MYRLFLVLTFSNVVPTLIEEFIASIPPNIWVEFQKAHLAASVASMLGMLKLEIVQFQEDGDSAKAEKSAFTMSIFSSIFLSIALIAFFGWNTATFVFTSSLSLLYSFLNYRLNAEILSQRRVSIFIISLIKISLIPMTFIVIVLSMGSLEAVALIYFFFSIILILVKRDKIISLQNLINHILLYVRYTRDLLTSNTLDYICSILLFKVLLTMYPSETIVVYYLFERFVVAPIGVITSAFSKVLLKEGSKFKLNTKYQHRTIAMSLFIFSFGAILIVGMVNASQKYFNSATLTSLMSEPYFTTCVMLLLIQGYTSMYSNLFITYNLENELRKISIVNFSFKLLLLAIITFLGLNLNIFLLISLLLTSDFIFSLYMYWRNRIALYLYPNL